MLFFGLIALGLSEDVWAEIGFNSFDVPMSQNVTVHIPSFPDEDTYFVLLTRKDINFLTPDIKVW